MNEPRILFHMLLWMLLASVFALSHGVGADGQEARPPVCAAHKFDNNNSPLELPVCYLDEEGYRSDSAAEATGTASSTTSVTPPGQKTAAAESELDAESPLDTANFLSFEEWKKQNLAKIGQSADNVGGKRQGNGLNQERRTQARAINNALDALGDDAEIDLNFGGFGSENSNNNNADESWGRKTSEDSAATEAHGMQNIAGDDAAGGVSAVGRRKDAGTTCKERFNYASFDCAATVLKTNPECSGSSSVLIENKDSYMLNECRAKNKFLILELCDDILVDTIVLANYEFFSSIFHTFRVSVSDRYPVKADKWKELGVFEAKNTRAVQAFAVENPLIWARYVRIEFLTHYGNEFYCPLSLVRIHGTTMLEEYKNEGDSRAEEDLEDAASADPVDSAVAEESPVTSHPENSTVSAVPTSPAVSNETSPRNRHSLEEAVFNYFLTATCAATENPTPTVHATSTQTHSSSPTTATTTDSVKPTDAASAESATTPEHVTGHAEHTNSSHVATSSSTASQNGTLPESAASNSTTTSTKETSSVSAEATRVTPSNPPSPNPTTQESFFKSVNKRLQMLESNSSLSLLYIEEQSQILREAFSKVEKRQMTKLNSFLENLNATVIDEIRNLQDVYQSLRTVMLDDFENQKREVSSTASQLAVLTDELVFQKRMTAISSVLIILLFALILTPRSVGGTVGGMIDFQSMMAWSPRQPSSPKTPKLSDMESSTTSSPESADTQRRHIVESFTSAATTVPNTNNHNTPPEEPRLVSISPYAKDQTRTRSLSDISERDRTYSHPSSPGLRKLLNEGNSIYDEATPTLRAGVAPKLMLMKRSPIVQQERPVSSPPVLTRPDLAAAAAAATARVSDGESEGASDTSTEPFPPCPQ